MGDRRFYLYQRKNGVFYAEFLDLQTGQRVLYRSTGTKIREDALITVGKWLEGGLPSANGRKRRIKEVADLKTAMSFIKSGVFGEGEAMEMALALKGRGLISLGVTPAGIGNKPLVDFLYEFWNYEKSPYLRDRRAHGKYITKRSCIEAARIIKGDWQPYFKEKTISNLTRNDLREFGIFLRERLTGKTVNNRLNVGTSPLRWAFREKLIPENPAEGLGGFSGGEKTRDILSPEEVEKLKDPRLWENKKAFAAFRLASTSALRSGEVRALRREDIGEGVLHVRHGYNTDDGIKSCKNGKERSVYLLPEVRGLLMDLLEGNPLTDNPDKQFVFFSDHDPGKPCGNLIFVKYLRKAIDAAGIDLGTRRVDFHSLRHFVAKELADATGDLRIVGRITGHLDPRMAERYANHTSDAEMAALGEQAAKILSFNGRKGA